ncbi:unnamed protein product, partial [Ectocarpus sp. 12 AP-2014]
VERRCVCHEIYSTSAASLGRGGTMLLRHAAVRGAAARAANIRGAACGFLRVGGNDSNGRALSQTPRRSARRRPLSTEANPPQQQPTRDR